MEHIVDKASAFTKKYITKGILPYIWIAVISAVSVTFFSLCLYEQVFSFRAAQLMGAVSVLVVVAVAVYLGVIKQLTTKRLLFLALVAGFLLRMTYVVYTPAPVGQHDVEMAYTYNVTSNGHFGYIMTLYNTGKLPATNDYQMYHPPLMHMLCAFGIWIGTVLNIQIKNICELLQILPLYISTMLMVVMVRIIHRMKLSEPMMIVTSFLVIFHSSSMVLSGAINNDGLMWLLFCIAVLYLMKWQENPTLKNIIVIAFSLGLGMMTKISAALLIPIIAAVFIYKFIKNYKTSAKSFYIQFALFLLISVPIAMWYPIRNYILFEQPLNYVHEIGTDRFLYTGDHSFAERFLIDFEDLSNGIFADVHDRNLWVILSKSAAYDELIFTETTIWPVLLFAINYLFIFATVPGMVYTFIKERKKIDYLILAAVWLILVGSFISFNISYPYSCTASHRYIIPAIMVGAIFIARACEHLKERCKWLGYAYMGITAVFVLSTFIAYTTPQVLIEIPEWFYS